MWRAWIGFNFSHGLGVMLTGALGIWAGSRIKTFPTGIMPALTLVGCVYLVLALRYWFRAPAIGVAIGTSCFAAAWTLSLRWAPLLIGAVAIGTVSSALYAPCLAGGCAMVHTVVSTKISAPPEFLATLYADYEGWPRLFPATIHGVRLLADDGKQKTIEVDHATERQGDQHQDGGLAPRDPAGRVQATLRCAIHQPVEADGQGTRYSIVADVQLKDCAHPCAPGLANRAGAVKQIRARGYAGRCRERAANASTCDSWHGQKAGLGPSLKRIACLHST
jgi:hypothetical protein